MAPVMRFLTRPGVGRRGLTQLCLMLGLCASIACEEPVSSVRFELYAAGRDNAPQPLLTGLKGDVIEMVIVRASDPRETDVPVDFNIADGKGRLPVLPFADDYWFYVRGFVTGDSDNVPQFYGAATNISINGDDEQVVSVQIGESNCVGLNLGSAFNRDVNGSDDMKTGRLGATATRLPDGRVLFAGGASVNMDGTIGTVLDTMEVYDPKRGQFIGLPQRLLTPRAHHSATLLDDGTVLLFGGIAAMENGTPRVTATASIVNLDSLVPVQSITPPLPASEGRYQHRAVKLDDGRGSVLITGGSSANGNPLATTWRYFPADFSNGPRFLQQGDLWTPRAQHSANRIQHDPEYAMIAGGIGAAGVLSASEVFTIRPAQGSCVDPNQTPTAEVGCFQKLGANLGLGAARFGHEAVEIDDGGQVAYIGGFTNADRTEFAQQIELVDRDLNRASAGTLNTGRGEFSANLLADGSVILLGGRRGNAALTTSEILRPQRDSTKATARFDASELSADCDLSEPRYGHNAVTLEGGTVLVGAGLTASGALTLVSRRGEIYFPDVRDIGLVYPRP